MVFAPHASRAKFITQPNGTTKVLTPARVTSRDRSPRFPRLTFPPFHLQPLDAPQHRLSPSNVSSDFQVSPSRRRLTATPSRNEFVNLRTGVSPPVAPHPASRRRSFLWLQSSWLTLARTYTELIRRHHGRTSGDRHGPRRESRGQSPLVGSGAKPRKKRNDYAGVFCGGFAPYALTCTLPKLFRNIIAGFRGDHPP
jgi:hypothetical protein